MCLFFVFFLQWVTNSTTMPYVATVFLSLSRLLSTTCLECYMDFNLMTLRASSQSVQWEEIRREEGKIFIHFSRVPLSVFPPLGNPAFHWVALICPGPGLVSVCWLFSITCLICCDLWSLSLQTHLQSHQIDSYSREVLQFVCWWSLDSGCHLSSSLTQNLQCQVFGETRGNKGHKGRVQFRPWCWVGMTVPTCFCVPRLSITGYW